MQRNAVRAGVFDQRSRATTKRRDRREQEVAPSDTLGDLREWLQERYGGLRIDDLERMDLKAFVRDAGCFDVEPTECLRQLAIAVENEGIAYGARGWRALKRIYDLARRISSENVAVLHSSAVSAREVADICDGEDADAIWTDALDAIHQALALAPDDGDAHAELGMILYFRSQTQEALDAFNAALQRDPHLGWAQLYRAHCLHDQGAWKAAMEAYDSVDLAQFGGPSSWRVDVLREQRAQCRLMSGDRAGALHDFGRILDRYEREPHLAFHAMSASLWAAAEGELKAELHERVVAIDRLGLESQGLG